MQVDFGRVITAMVTPFNEKLEVDYLKAKELAAHLIAARSDSLVVAGTTGEVPTLTFEEKVLLFQAVKEAVGEKAKVIANTGTNATEASLELTRKAEAIGVDGVMFVVPYYNKPSQEGLYRHFSTLAQATKLPVMLYNVPSRTGTNLAPETVARLAVSNKNIVALKQANGNLDELSEIIRLAGPGFQVYSGDDSLTLPMLALGASGVVSVASHLVGKELQEMIASFTKGLVEQARETHLRLFPLFKALFVTSNPVPVKAALELTGFSVGGVRPPLVGLGTKEQEVLKEALRMLNLFNA